MELIKEQKEKLKSVENDEYEETLVTTLGRNANGRLAIIKALYSDDIHRLNLIIYDRELKKNQKLILDNINYSDLTTNEMEESAQILMKKIDYDFGTKQYYLNSKNQNDLSIFTLSPTRRRSSRVLNNLLNSKLEIKPETHQIYRGVKKGDRFYYDIKISLTVDNRAEIDVGKQRDGKTNLIKVDTDIRKYLGANPSNEIKLELGRMIYNEVNVSKKEGVNFDQNKFKDLYMMNLFQKRNLKLLKIQNCYRYYTLRRNIKDNTMKLNFERCLITKFIMKIGKQYHFIKITMDKDRIGIIYIQSDKSKNILKTKVEGLGFKKDADLFQLKNDIKIAISGLIAFNSVKCTLVFYKRRK